MCLRFTVYKLCRKTQKKCNKSTGRVTEAQGIVKLTSKPYYFPPMSCPHISMSDLRSIYSHEDNNLPNFDRIAHLVVK